MPFFSKHFLLLLLDSLKKLKKIFNHLNLKKIFNLIYFIIFLFNLLLFLCSSCLFLTRSCLLCLCLLHGSGGGEVLLPLNLHPHHFHPPILHPNPLHPHQIHLQPPFSGSGFRFINNRCREVAQKIHHLHPHHPYRGGMDHAEPSAHLLPFAPPSTDTYNSMPKSRPTHSIIAFTRVPRTRISSVGLPSYYHPFHQILRNQTFHHKRAP